MADETTPPPDPTPAPAPDSAPADAPPAAVTVVTGKTEREIDLERQVAERDSRIKARETRVSELEDENHRLKTPQPVPIKKKPAGSPFYFGQEDED